MPLTDRNTWYTPYMSRALPCNISTMIKHILAMTFINKVMQSNIFDMYYVECKLANVNSNYMNQLIKLTRLVVDPKYAHVFELYSKKCFSIITIYYCIIWFPLITGCRQDIYSAGYPAFVLDRKPHIRPG